MDRRAAEQRALALAARKEATIAAAEAAGREQRLASAAATSAASAAAAAATAWDVSELAATPPLPLPDDWLTVHQLRAARAHLVRSLTVGQRQLRECIGRARELGAAAEEQLRGGGVGEGVSGGAWEGSAFKWSLISTLRAKYLVRAALLALSLHAGARRQRRAFVSQMAMPLLRELLRAVWEALVTLVTPPELVRRGERAAAAARVRTSHRALGWWAQHTRSETRARRLAARYWRRLSLGHAWGRLLERITASAEWQQATLAARQLHGRAVLSAHVHAWRGLLARRKKLGSSLGTSLWASLGRGSSGGGGGGGGGSGGGAS